MAYTIIINGSIVNLSFGRLINSFPNNIKCICYLIDNILLASIDILIQQDRRSNPFSFYVFFETKSNRKPFPVKLCMCVISRTSNVFKFSVF